MQLTPATPAQPGRNSTWRLEHCHSSLCIRLHCEPTPAHERPRIVPQLTRADRANRFISREVAELIAATYLPHTPVEIVRVDA